MTPLFLALLAACTLSLALRDAGKAAVAFVLLGNWLINTGLCWVTGEPFPWPLFMLIDYLSGLALIGTRRNGWQVAVIASYIAELVAHAGFALSSRTILVEDRYWLTLYAIAWAQVAIIGGWIAYDIARDLSGPVRRMAPRLSAVLGRDKP